MEICDLKKLLQEMTLEEKVGQMIQIHSNFLSEGGVITGPTDSIELTEEMLSLVGSVLGSRGAESLRQIQDDFMKKHPHHIPLLMMQDIINGAETIFPIPLAQGCTFSPELVEKAASVAAAEAACGGLHVTFSPMLDLVRDSRWGRVMESPGEDPWLNGQMGKAMVRGYQGTNALKEEGKIGGCVKHFAGYGAPDGGRDYDNVELSERTFREDYLVAYKAAIEEGSSMVMTSFNTWNRIPATANTWLMRKVLREEIGFDGVLISDYDAIGEMIKHGIAEDSRDAAKMAIRSGVDIDMMSSGYVKNLVELVRSGEVEEGLIDDAVWRILKLKNDLGLFENPYKDGSTEKEATLIGCEAHRKLARQAAASSFVLLKNEQILPLDKTSAEKVAFIGPYVDTKEIYGTWSFPEKPEKMVSIREGVEQKKSDMVYAQGSYMLDENQCTRFDKYEEYTQEQLEALMEEALAVAASADKVVLCLGEHKDQSGEGGSRTSIKIPEHQMELLRIIQKVNRNIITVVFSARPLEVKEIAELSKAVLMVWIPGTESGNAIADVLFGDCAPEGRLSMTLPRSVGQVPIYYNKFSTGRMNPTGTKVGFINGYIDESTKPLYPFGYGLSYTEFAYGEVKLDKTEMTPEEIITATVTVTNTGSYTATETVQMYLRDVKASVVRPVKMLRGVQKVTLEPGECKEVSFEITEEMLKFYDINMEYVSEPGLFYVYIGHDSDTENMNMFKLNMEDKKLCEKKAWVLGCLAPACGQLAKGFYNAGPMFADDRNGITSEDSRMQVVFDVAEADFDAYVADLKTAGMNGYLERSLGKDKFFAFAYAGKYYHVSFIEKRGEIRVVEDVLTTPISEFGYYKKGEQKSVFYQYGLYYDPNNDMTETTANCGMIYVVRLSDNSLFMVDGGYIYQCTNEMIEGLWKFLLRITNTPEDGTIRIAGWYFTHAHDDHTDGCTKLLNRYHEQIVLERVMFNFPCFWYNDSYSIDTYLMKEAVAKYYPQAKLLKLHTGQKFLLADMTVEVMYTQEDAAEREDLSKIHLQDFNSTSSILKLTLDGKDIMMLGDTNIETEILLKKYSEEKLWKADMVQVAHHCFNYLDTMYEWIGAPMAVVPNTYFAAHRWDNIDKLAGVLKWVKDDQVYYEGEGTDAFVAAEDGFKHVETLPVVGGEYDFSGL